MKKQMNVGKTIAVIVCVFLLVLAVGSIAFFTNGFTSDFKTFYVESDGNRMLSDYDNYIMKQDAENKESTTQKSNLNVTIKTEYSEENSIDDTSSILSSSMISYSRNPNSSSIFAKEKLNTYFTSKKQNHIDTSKMDISSNNKSNIDDYA